MTKLMLRACFALIGAVIPFGCTAGMEGAEGVDDQSGQSIDQVLFEGVAAVLQHELLSIKGFRRSCLIDSQPLSNVGNRYSLSLSSSSDRLGGDLLDLRGVDRTHAESFIIGFSNAARARHSPGLIHAINQFVSKEFLREEEVGVLEITFSDCTLNADGDRMLLALALQWDPLAGFDKIYYLEKSDAGWIVEDAVVLTIS